MKPRVVAGGWRVRFSRRIIATDTTHDTGGQRLGVCGMQPGPRWNRTEDMNSSTGTPTIDNTSSTLGATWMWSTT